MINLVGEQPAPNLLPVYELQPQLVFLVATSRTKTVAHRIKSLLAKREYRVNIIYGEPYDVETTFRALNESLQDNRLHDVKLLGNFTGGTKLMVLALLRMIREWPTGGELCYLQTERTQGVLRFYDPFKFSPLREQLVTRTISLEDYLTSYLGDYRLEGPSYGEGGKFERAVAQALEPHVDEIVLGLKKGGALEIDIVVLCGNRVGIIEAKTGEKARKKEGIDQLNTAGGREFLGTYVKKFLVVNAPWDDRTNLRELAQARDIVVVELTKYDSNTGLLPKEEAERLVGIVQTELRCQR